MMPPSRPLVPSGLIAASASASVSAPTAAIHGIASPPDPSPHSARPKHATNTRPIVTAQTQTQTMRQVMRLIHNASVGLPTTSRAAALWARGFSGVAAVAAAGCVGASASGSGSGRASGRGVGVGAGAGVGGGRAGQAMILRRQTSHAAQTQSHPKSRADLTRAYGAAAIASPEPHSHSHSHVRAEDNHSISLSSSASRQRPNTDTSPHRTRLRKSQPLSRSVPPRSSNNKVIPSSMAGGMRLPGPLYQRLTRYDVIPAEFRDAFSEKGLQPGDLAHVYALQAVWGVWLGWAAVMMGSGWTSSGNRHASAGRASTAGADPSLWAWLAGQLGHLLHDDVNQDVRALAQAMRAYALVQLGQTREALAALDAGLPGASRSPLALAIRSLAYTGLSQDKGGKVNKERHVAEADRAAVLALRRACAGDYLVPEQLEQTVARVFEQFGENEGEDGVGGPNVPRRRSMDAALGLIRDSGQHVRSAVLSYEEGHRAYTAVLQRVVERVMDVLVRADDPCAWFRGELGLRAGQVDGQEQVQDGAQGSGASQNTRWMGSMLLAAHLRAGHSDRSRNSTDRIQALLDVIQQHSLPLPASLHLEALVALANAREGSSGAVEIASLVQANADNLPHARLSEVLQLAARRSMRELGVLTWDIIEWRCSPLPSDRYHAALLGLSDDVDVLKGRIERTIGSLDQPDALDVLLRKYIVSNDIIAAQTTFDKLVALRPTRVAYERMLAFYAAHARADDAIELFDSMLLRGIQPTLASLTSLVALFANRRDVENAQKVFDMIPAMGFTPDSAAWTAIMNAEVEAGQWTAAALRWQGMPDDMKQTRSVLGVVMKAYLHMAAPTSKVLEVFENAREEDRTGHMWSVAIQSAVDDRDFDLAESLFERMRRAYTANASRPEPSVFHYSILLYGYMQADQQSRAKQVYDAMLERGIVPTSVTYGMMLSSWRHADGVTAYAQASRFARSVHLHAVQSNEKPRARGGAMENIYGPLISLSGNIGDMETAEGYLKLAATPLNAMGGKARGDPALTGQEMMLDENGAGVGELSSMTAQDVEAHFASDRPAQALTMYTRLLDVYRRSGQTDSVMAIWDHIFALACRVSKETASKHLTGVRSRRSRDNILCIPLSIVLDSLGAAGRLMDVRSTWERVSKAGFGFDAQNYNHYAVALARTGDVERAFAVVEDVLYPRYRAVIKRQMRAVREAERLEGERVTSASHLDADANIEDVWESGPRVMPENMTRIALQEGNSLNGADIITQPAQRPPNRRSEQRWAGGAFSHGQGRDDGYGASSWGAESTYGENPSSGTGTGTNGKRPSIDVTMLKAWRTTDILWRPSVTTISVLEHVWKQLQEAKSRAWFVFADGGGEGDADADAEEDGVGVAGGTKSAHANGNGQDGGVVTLPAFGDVPVRDANGEISKSSPTAIIMRLNKRYVKTVALIMFHRRKRHAANLKARRGG